MNTGWDDKIAEIFCGVILFVLLVVVLVIGFYGGFDATFFYHE